MTLKSSLILVLSFSLSFNALAGNGSALIGWQTFDASDPANNNANTAGSINLSDANAMSSNPLYPNARGSQHGWGADGADGADVDSFFTLTGAAAVNGQTTNYRLQSVTLELAPTAVPVPAAAWLFASAMVGLVGMSRNRSAV